MFGSFQISRPVSPLGLQVLVQGPSVSVALSLGLTPLVSLVESDGDYVSYQNMLYYNSASYAEVERGGDSTPATRVAPQKNGLVIV